MSDRRAALALTTKKVVNEIIKMTVNTPAPKASSKKLIAKGCLRKTAAVRAD